MAVELTGGFVGGCRGVHGEFFGGGRRGGKGGEHGGERQENNNNSLENLVLSFFTPISIYFITTITEVEDAMVEDVVVEELEDEVVEEQDHCKIAISAATTVIALFCLSFIS